LKKFLLAPQFIVLLLLALFSPAGLANLDLRVTTSATNITFGQTITYTIVVSNTSPTQVQGVQIINNFPVTASVVSAVNTYTPNAVTTNSGQVVFTLNTLPTGVQAQMSLQLRPLSERTNFINNILAQAFGVPTVSTNVRVVVGAQQADLAVGVEGFPTNAVLSDWFDYTITMTNFGPAVADGISVQSVLPNGISFISVDPPLTSTFNTNTRILSLNLGTLTNNFAQDLLVRMKATTTNNQRIVTSVVTSENADPTSGNDAVTNTLTVLDYVTNRVAIIGMTPQKLNFQNGLMEQLVTITNLTTNTLSSVRLVVTNLQSPNSLYNVAGTNNSNPFLMILGPLGPTNSMQVLVQFVAPSRTPIPVNYIALEGPSLTSLPTPTGTIVPISRFTTILTTYDPARPRVRYASVYIEFPTTVGKSYSLVYVTTVDGTNWVAVQPPLVANSTHGQFTDTAPQVSGEGDRFYHVIEHN
jgi:uncharacterized repeat protein (TIGR01451 family)